VIHNCEDCDSDRLTDDWMFEIIPWISYGFFFIFDLLIIIRFDFELAFHERFYPKFLIDHKSSMIYAV